jgi:hypothetical protein
MARFERWEPRLTSPMGEHDIALIRTYWRLFRR